MPEGERLAHLAGATMVDSRAPKAFLKRAAVLHTDTAFKRELDVPVQDCAVKDDVKSDGPAVPPVSGRPYSRAPVAAESVTSNQDGKTLGNTLSDWNWPFARSLLAAPLPEAR